MIQIRAAGGIGQLEALHAAAGIDPQIEHQCVVALAHTLVFRKQPGDVLLQHAGVPGERSTGHQIAPALLADQAKTVAAATAVGIDTEVRTRRWFVIGRLRRWFHILHILHLGYFRRRLLHGRRWRRREQGDLLYHTLWLDRRTGHHLMHKINNATRHRG